MNIRKEKDLKNDSSTVQSTENGGQPSTQKQEKGPIAAGRAILDELMSQPNESAKRMEELVAMRVKSWPLLPPAKTILAVDGVSTIEAGDIYLIKGKPKSGKSSIIKAFICAIVLGYWGCVKATIEGMKILYIDTEQKPQDCQAVLTYLKDVTGVSDEYIDEHIMLYSVRKRERNLLADDLALLVSHWKPQFIILDGSADFVNSFNDEVECSELVHRFLCIVEENDCALVSLIHENKAADDFNAKGHLGSLLVQKSALVIEARKAGDLIKVCCSEARHKSMPDWYLTYDENGMLQDGSALFAERNANRSQNLRDSNREKSGNLVKERVELAHTIIHSANGRISRADLTARMAAQLERDRSTISGFISSQIGKTLFLVNDMIQETSEVDLPF